MNKSLINQLMHPMVRVLETSPSATYTLRTPTGCIFNSFLIYKYYVKFKASFVAQRNARW
jgi:hypothetical protein